MNKKYLIINGSGRKNGVTNMLCDRLVTFLGEENVTVFDTYKEEFLPCNGCDFCSKHGKCVNDDLKDFFTTFEECDRIIFLSPVFNGNFPGPLKSLIDRFQVYYTGFYRNNKRQVIKKSRQAWFVAASGQEDNEAFEYMQKQLKRAFTILNIEMVESFLCAKTDYQNDYQSVAQDLKRSLNND